MLLLSASLLIVGCGDSAGPNVADQEKNVQNAQNMRSYFEKSGGDYEKLNDVDKAAFIKLSGDEEKAKRNWDLMKNGPGAADRSGGTATPGP